MNTKYFIEQVKNNLALIILLPTVFGGLWQIIELSKMSIAYIRFFSATQLVPDGLLMLFILATLYLAYKLGILQEHKINFNKKMMIIHIMRPKGLIHYFIKTNKSNKLTYSENPIYKKSVIPSYMAIVLLGIPFLFYLLSFILFNESEDNSKLLSIMMSITLVMVLGGLILNSARILYEHIIENNIIKIVIKYISDKPIIKELIFIPIKLLSAILFLGLILVPIYLFSLFHKNYFLPENLKNLENIQTSLNAKDYNKSEILYFNDKYIFIEHSNSDKNTTIEIVLFDKLFNKN